MTKDFIEDASRHNPEGLKRLISERRKLLALLDDKAPSNLSKMVSAELLQELRNQDAELKTIEQNIRRDLEKTLNSLRWSSAVFRKMRSSKPTSPRYIDRKS